MDENIYQAPESELLDGDAVQLPFYVVSQKKFLILFFATAGLYSVVWFYQHWKQYRESSGENVWPVARAVFSIFFTHTLFRHFDTRARQRDDTLQWSPSGMATVYVLAEIFQGVTDRVVQESYGEPYLDFLSILLMLFVAWPLYRAQQFANLACDDAEGKANHSLTAVNVLWIVIGALLWLLILIGLYDVAFGLPDYVDPVL